MSQKSHWKSRMSALVLALFATVHFVAAQSQPDVKTRKFKLAKITFEGLSTMTPENAIALSGLQIGQTVMLENLTAALQEMLNKGQISEGRYSYQYRADNIEVTFTVKEARGSLPVYFDNFIWFTDEEINKAIRQVLPSYDGKLTEGSEMVTTVQRALEKMLQEKNIKGRIENEMIGLASAYIFRVADLPMPVCAATFLGAQAFNEAQLNGAVKEMFNADFSRQIDRIIVRDRIIPMYREHGYLKIRVPAVDGHPAESGKCDKGSSQVTVKLEEGIAYKWKGASFSGNQVFATEKLMRVFTLKPNEIADGIKIDKAFMSAYQLYAEAGYFKAEIPAQPIFDDGAQTVSYNIAIAEGPHFNFGQLAIKGLTQELSNELLIKWKDFVGKPYEARTFSQFVTEAQRKTNFRLPPTANTSLQEDSLSVNFVLEFQ